MFDGLKETDLNMLLKHVQEEKLSHAYMFYGSKIETLDKIALGFIKMIYCNNSKYYCDDCIECKKVDDNGNMDIHHIYKDGKSISIKQIREIGYKSNIYSKEYRYNIFVIHEADCMTIEAENAFLKTLEEPFENTIFILLAKSKEVLLDTILSRCLSIKVEDYEDVDVLDESEQMYIMEALEQIYSGNRLKVIEVSKKLSSNADKVENYMLFMLKFITDVLIYKESNLEMTFNKNKGFYKDYIVKINSIASSKSLTKLMDRMVYVNEAFKYNAKPTLGFESIFMCIEEGN